jgi:hypothetical protein
LAPFNPKPFVFEVVPVKEWVDYDFCVILEHIKAISAYKICCVLLWVTERMKRDKKGRTKSLSEDDFALLNEMVFRIKEDYDALYVMKVTASIAYLAAFHAKLDELKKAVRDDTDAIFVYEKAKNLRGLELSTTYQRTRVMNAVYMLEWRWYLPFQFFQCVIDMATQHYYSLYPVS